MLSVQSRRRLREHALRLRPWEKSTGPRTPEGKAKVSRNSRKHGYWSRVAIRARKTGEVVQLEPVTSRQTSLRRMFFARLSRLFRCDRAGEYDRAEVAAELRRRAESLRRDAPRARALLCAQTNQPGSLSHG